jgi:hypothetical protein
MQAAVGVPGEPVGHLPASSAALFRDAAQRLLELLVADLQREGKRS